MGQCHEALMCVYIWYLAMSKIMSNTLSVVTFSLWPRIINSLVMVIFVQLQGTEIMSVKPVFKVKYQHLF